MAGPFDAYFEQKQKEEAARAAAKVRLDPLQPDQAADGIATARELGVPAGQVMAFPQVFKDRLAQQKATTALTGAPKMSDWLGSDPLNGALAKDDLDNLSWWEKAPIFTGNALRRGAGRVGQSYNQAQAGWAAGRMHDRQRSFSEIVQDERNPVIVDGKEVAREWAGPGDLVASLYRYSASRIGDLIGDDEAAAVQYQQQAAEVAQRIAAIPMSEGAAAARDRIAGIDGNATIGEQFQQFAGAVAADPAGFTSFLAQIAAESLPSIAASAAVGVVTRSPTAAAAAMGGSSGFQEYGTTQTDFLEKSGHDLTTPEGALAAISDERLMRQAAERGELRGLIIGAMDGLSGGLAGQALSRSPVGNMIAQGFAQAIMGGGGEAAAQLATDGKVKVADVLVEALAEFATAPAEVAAMGGRAGLSALRQSRRAGQTASMIDEASAQAQGSLLRERSPEAFKAALDRAGRGDDLLFVPAQGLREFFQARDTDFDAEMAEAWGIDLSTFAEMEISGGRVGVPVSNFAAYLAGTDAEAWVRENATLDPDEMSLGDAALFNEAVQDDLQRAYEQDQEAQAAETQTRASDQQVFDNLFSQLRTAGRTVEVADKEARVMSAFFRTMAQRVGEDSLDLMRRFGLRIEGPEQQAVARQRGPLDVMLNDLRSGRKEKTGRSLTQFVIDSGGVQDAGGDVAALEVKGLVAETAQEIAARTAQVSMDGMPSAGRGLPLDELGRMAVEAGYFPELMGEVQGLNDGEAADLGRALLDALTEEASGRPRYIEGEGPDPARAALNAELQRRGLDVTALSNDEIAAALEQAEEGREYGQASLMDDTRTWRSKIADFMAGKLKDHHDLRVGATNDVLRSVGVPRGQMVMRASKLRKVATEHPEVGREAILNLPALLDDPAMVYAEQGKESDLVVVTRQKSSAGDPVVVAIKKQGKSNNQPATIVLTIYDLQDAKEKISRKASDLLYVRDDEVSREYELTGANSLKGPQVRPPSAKPDRKILSREDVFKGREYGQGNRGSIVLPRDGALTGETVINLFESADLSTFSHEAAHFFLEATDALAREDGAPQELRDEVAAIRKYLGAEDGAEFTEAQHETFARSFEAYILEGKAPSLELADVFARMKAWLTRIYRSIAGLNVPINDEIRGVFDRMLATDAEIAAARAEAAADPLFREKPAGMSDADWNTYQRMARRSKEQAEAKLINKTMERVRREKEAWWKAERKEVRKQVEAAINTEPRYRLIEAMANGRFLTADGATDAPDMRIDRTLLVEQFGPGILAELQRQKFGGKRAIYGDGGMTPGEAADMFGFAGAADMIQTLQNTGKRTDAIEAETDRIMLDRYGDPMTDGTIEQEAMDAIHNEQQAQKNVAEARQMASQLGRDTRGMTARLYRQRARLMLGRMSVREAAAPARFLAAERQAGRNAERAFAKVVRGDSGALAEALQAKEQQILNAALYDLSREAEAEVTKARERMQGYGKKSVREKLEGGYIEQIDDLLDRYDFRKRGPGQIAKTERLREFMDRMIAEGRESELAIDPRMMDEARRIHYSRLSLDEFRGLTDTIANLDHLGRFKQKLINARRRRELQDSVDRVVGEVRQRGRDEITAPRGDAAQFFRDALTLTKSADTIMVELDGLKELGSVYDELKRDVSVGEQIDQQMRIEMRDKLDALYREHYTAKQIDQMRKPTITVPGHPRQWSKLEILAAMSNTGTESNFQRLTDERAHVRNRLTAQQVNDMAQMLDENDWRFVQGQWDLINSFWPELEAVGKRRTGVAPKKVDAKLMVQAPSFVTGGYYPVRYDPRLSAAAATDQASLWDKVMTAGHGGRAAVRAGMLQERQSSSGGRTLMLDLGVGVQGMQDTIRVIALSEAVDNSSRILRHPEVKSAFIERGLQSEWNTLDLWLRDVAEGPIFNSDPLNRLARITKMNLTTMFLAFNLKTAILQVTGLAQSAAVIGKRNMMHGMLAYVKAPGEMAKNVTEASAFMAERQRTFQKDIYDMRADPRLANPVAGKIARGQRKIGQYGFMPIQLMQFYAVDLPTWAGAYRSQIDAGASEDAAVEYADRMVARSQDSGFMGDRSGFARGTLSQTVRQSDIVRFWTTLGGYFLVKLNRGMIEAQRGVQNVRQADSIMGKVSSAANMATNLTLLYVVEGAIMSLAYELLDDDDETDDMTKNILKETGMAIVGGFPILRDMAAFAANGRGAGGMYQTVGEIPGRIFLQASQGENDKAFRSAVANGVGLVTGLPTTSTMRVVEGVIGESDTSFAEMFFGRNPLND